MAEPINEPHAFFAGDAFGPDLRQQLGGLLDRLVHSAQADEPPDLQTRLLARVVLADQLTTHLGLIQARDLRGLRDECRRVQDAAHSTASLGAADRAARDPDGWAPSLAGWNLGLSEYQVRARLAFADGLLRYGDLAELVEQCRVPIWTAMKTSEHLDALAHYLSEDDLHRQERAVVRWLASGHRTVGALHRRMERLLVKARTQAHPDPDSDRPPPADPSTDAPCPGTPDDAPPRPGDGGVMAAHTNRRVGFRANTDGTTLLWAILPDADALAIATCLDGATSDRAPDCGRGRDQRRADLLVAAVAGAPACYGTSGDVPPMRTGAGGATGVRPAFTVCVPVGTILGTADDPGEGPRGFEVLPATTMRELASEHDATFRGLFYDPATGHLLGTSSDLATLLAAISTGPVPTRHTLMNWTSSTPSTTAYQHPDRTARFIHDRDGTCGLRPATDGHCAATATTSSPGHRAPPRRATVARCAATTTGSRRTAQAGGSSAPATGRSHGTRQQARPTRPSLSTTDPRRRRSHCRSDRCRRSHPSDGQHPSLEVRPAPAGASPTVAADARP